MDRRRGRRAALAVAALAAFSSPAYTPVTVAPAFAQEIGAVRVNLVESVGQDWFSRIGDRTVTLSRIEGIDPDTAEGRRKLSQLDVPALLAEGTTFPEVARTTTSAGEAVFDGIDRGVYYLEVLDNPDTSDSRVSYAPFVVVVREGELRPQVALKAQVLGISAEALTACNTPAWRDAAAPGTDVEYDYTASVPNLSVDGTLGVYELTLDFSVGHTVKWKDSQPSSEIVALAPAGTYVFDAVGDTVRIEAQDSWWERLVGVSRQEEEVVKLEAPTLTLSGAGENHELVPGEDYTVVQKGDDQATFALSKDALETMARLRASDPHTTVHLRVPARANERAPWGTVKRGDVIGTLETTATLRTDGMDAHREPVTVSETSHVNVVNRGLCFGKPGNGGVIDPGLNPGDGGTNTPKTPGDGTSTSTNTTDTSSPRRGADGDTVTGDGDRDGVDNPRPRGLASTGASVIGVTVLAVLLLIFGFWLRRRKEEDDEQ